MAIVDYLVNEDDKHKTLINDEIFHAFDFDGYYRTPKYVEIFKNPTYREINDIKNADKEFSNQHYKGGNVRLASIGDDIYAWVASCLHDDALDYMNNDLGTRYKWDHTFIYPHYDPNIIICNEDDIYSEKNKALIEKLFKIFNTADAIVDFRGNMLYSKYKKM